MNPLALKRHKRKKIRLTAEILVILAKQQNGL
jgi:hypothetical protein